MERISGRSGDHEDLVDPSDPYAIRDNPARLIRMAGGSIRALPTSCRPWGGKSCL